MKKTKIICTIGPSSANIDELKQMIKNGMNVARINFSHGTYASHQIAIDLIHQLRRDLKVPISILADTKGPEIRFGDFENGRVELKKGEDFVITKNQVLGNNKIASVSYPSMIKDLKLGEKIYANNGMLILKVKQKNEDCLFTKVLFGGILTNHKGLNVPNLTIRSKYLSDLDKQDLLFTIKNDVEYIASSFVGKTEDVVEVRKFLDENGGKNILIISKIENQMGVKNIDKIAQISDGIMIARGDLGVEIALEKLPSIQKKIVSTCNKFGKICIVATEMLEGMTTSLRPTRAEVSDVAGSVFEKTTATMLSGETAIGIHPAHVVKTMSKIILETEKNVQYEINLSEKHQKAISITDSIAASASENATLLHAKAIVCFTYSGKTAHLISRYRTKTPILALTCSEKTYNKLAIGWNITPVLTEQISSDIKMLEQAKNLSQSLSFAKKDDIIIVVTGTPNETGATNMIKVIKI